MEPVATDDMIRSDPGEEEAERTARFSILLVCMLVGLMLAPLFGESDTGFTIARIVGVLILVAALSVVGVHRLAIVLFVPTLVVQLVGHRSNVPIVVVTSERCPTSWTTSVGAQRTIARRCTPTTEDRKSNSLN